MDRREATFEVGLIRLRALRVGERDRVEAMDMALKALKQPEVITCMNCRYSEPVRFLKDDVRLYCRWREEYGGTTDLELDRVDPNGFCSRGISRGERRKTGGLGDEK